MTAQSLRNRAYRPYDVVWIFGPLSDRAASGLPAALRDLVVRNERGAVGQAWPPRPLPAVRSRARAIAAAAQSIQHIPADCSDSALTRAAWQFGYHGIPISMTIAGDRVAVLLAHAVADGVEATAIVEALFALALGERPATAAPALRMPLARAVRVGGLAPFRSYLRHRGAVDAPALIASAPTAEQESRDGLQLVRFTLDGDDLRRVRRGGAGTSRGRATTASRLTSLALAALRVAALTQDDVTVRVPIDLRALMPGRRVAGNFVSVEPQGSLWGTDWSPPAISRRLAEQRARAVPSLVASLVRPLRDLPRNVGRRRPAAHREHGISVSALPAAAFPATAWRDGRLDAVGCATIGPWPSAAFVYILLAEASVSISVYDDSGRYELERFEAAFRSEIETRLA